MKIKTITLIIFGFLAGVIFSGIVISISSGEMMVKEFKSPYDFDKTVEVMTLSAVDTYVINKKFREGSE